jgi:hypothetical protein
MSAVQQNTFDTLFCSCIKKILPDSLHRLFSAAPRARSDVPNCWSSLTDRVHAAPLATMSQATWSQAGGPSNDQTETEERVDWSDVQSRNDCENMNAVNANHLQRVHSSQGRSSSPALGIAALGTRTTFNGSHGHVPWQTSRSRPEQSSHDWKSFRVVGFCCIPFHHPFGNQLLLHDHNILACCHDGHLVHVVSSTKRRSLFDEEHEGSWERANKRSKLLVEGASMGPPMIMDPL